MSFALSRNERLYLQVESAYGVIPNTTGTATVGNSNACRLIKASLDAQAALIKRPDKTGTRSQLIGVVGRKNSDWSIDMSLAPNGSAGVIPDCDPLLQGVFGQTPTIVGGTSVTYSLVDSIKSLALWSFRSPSTIDQRVCSGSVVKEMTIEGGPDVAMLKFTGEGKWTLSSNQFAFADTGQKSGLTSFPTEPGSPVTNGGMVIGFTGAIIVDGHTLATLRTCTMRAQTNNVTVKDTFGTFYPDSAEGDERNFMVDMSIYEDDTGTFQDLIQVSQDKTPITVSMTLGTVTGSMMTAIMSNVQLATPSREEQRRYIANWSGSVAHASSVSVRDEMTMAFV